MQQINAQEESIGFSLPLFSSITRARAHAMQLTGKNHLPDPVLSGLRCVQPAAASSSLDRTRKGRPASRHVAQALLGQPNATLSNSHRKARQDGQIRFLCPSAHDIAIQYSIAFALAGGFQFVRKW
jgi:hypothetical protein